MAQSETGIRRNVVWYGLVGILSLAAPVALVVGAPVTRYLIVSGNNSTGSWDSSDEGRLQEWRYRYGSEFAWFRQNGRDYIVTDDRTLAELQHALAPQREVNRRQEEVNRHQEDVNRLQDRVNGQQGEVNRAQDDVNRHQNLVNEGTGSQSDVNRLQEKVNQQQHDVNAEQEKVNQKQSVVNQEQEVVNRAQARASAEISKAIGAIFDSARRDGRARQIQ